MPQLIFQMNDIISLLSTLITVLGFFITYKCLKKEYSLAIKKEKTLYATNEMKEALEVSHELLWTYMRMFAYKIELEKDFSVQERLLKEVKRFAELRERLGKMIINFGTMESVKLWAYFEHNFLSMTDSNGSIFSKHEYNNYYIMSVLILIVVQIKYDIYGLKLSPKYLFLSLFTQEMVETNGFFDKVIEYNNEIVKKMNLDKSFIIADKNF